MSGERVPSMQEASSSDNPRACAQSSGGRFIDTLITQWTKHTGSNIALHQMEKQVAESSTAPEGKQQILQNQERVIQALQGRLRKSQETEASLSASLEAEMRNKEEIQTKLNATWESIDTITEYFNYISESLASFQQHRANLSALYDNVILKQQESIQNLQLTGARSKDLEQCVAQLESKSLLQEERLREATAERNKLRKQLEDCAYEMQSQRNELANAHTEEKMTLVKEQQRLLLEYENLQSRLQTIEREKCDVARSVAQLEDKSLLQEEKLQEALTERNKLQRQLESIESAFYLQKNNLASAHAEEKKMLVEEQRQLIAEREDLQLRLNAVERDRNDLTEMVARKDALLSKFQDENSAYKDKIEAMTLDNNEIYAKCEALAKQQNTWERELHKKTEMIQCLEATLSATKQREAGLVNDINRIEKNLINEMDYAKSLKSKLADTQRDLQFAQMQKTEMQKTLEKTKATNEFASNELQQQLKTLQREKEEIAKRESTRVKSAEILYENARAKHAEEVSTLRSDYETRLLELKRTVDRLNETANNIEKENDALNASLAEIRAENDDLRNNCRSLVERNDKLEGNLQQVAEPTRTKSEPISIAQHRDKGKFAKEQKRFNAKRKYEIHFDPEIMEIPEAAQCNVSTSVDLSDDEQSNSLMWPLNRAYSAERESQKEQEAEVTSAGRKFFKSRPAQPRTYAKRRQNS